MKLEASARLKTLSITAASGVWTKAVEANSRWLYLKGGPVGSFEVIKGHVSVVVKTPRGPESYEKVVDKFNLDDLNKWLKQFQINPLPKDKVDWVLGRITS